MVSLDIVSLSRNICMGKLILAYQMKTPELKSQALKVPIYLKTGRGTSNILIPGALGERRQM